VVYVGRSVHLCEDLDLLGGLPVKAPAPAAVAVAVIRYTHDTRSRNNGAINRLRFLVPVFGSGLSYHIRLE